MLLPFPTSFPDHSQFCPPSRSVFHAFPKSCPILPKHPEVLVSIVSQLIPTCQALSPTFFATGWQTKSRFRRLFPRTSNLSTSFCDPLLQRLLGSIVIFLVPAQAEATPCWSSQTNDPSRFIPYHCWPICWFPMSKEICLHQISLARDSCRYHVCCLLLLLRDIGGTSGWTSKVQSLWNCEMITSPLGRYSLDLCLLWLLKHSCYRIKITKFDHRFVDECSFCEVQPLFLHE